MIRDTTQSVFGSTLGYTMPPVTDPKEIQRRLTRKNAQTKHRLANKEEYATSARKARLKPVSREDAMFKSLTTTLVRHRLTLDQYHAMAENQDFLCACCFREPEITAFQLRGFVIDHNHRTNKVRALLCSRCNFALGHIEDDPLLAAALINYLKDYSGE